ncbi:GNAT family N-acetyltransferase [Streptococcus massiliensis]|uniref:Putative acetyltransferase n=1 Tax=Streptococcus massiliensis TaxID=313439 RepID=A0A380KY39_9STRE|nr:GNAT family N-acetyltransferase [Streptococcus massiliensis]SUN76189.1 putative acetyltransferase [Streptococcus massiliensis]
MENIYLKLAQHRVLETDRLLLRPVTLDDAEDMFEYASDLDTVRYVTFLPHQSVEDSRNQIAQFFLNYPLGSYGIEVKSDRKFIGTFGFVDLKQDVAKAEIGYCLNKDYWNQGYATEMLKAMVQLAFDKLDLNCLIARHDIENPASGRVLEKAGFIFSHKEPYAMLNKNQENRIMTLKHYLLTKEDYFKKGDE